MGALFQSAPAVMLCKPTNYDRWDKRAVELAAFVHLHGHSNVPLVSSPVLCSISAVCPRQGPLLPQVLRPAFEQTLVLPRPSFPAGMSWGENIMTSSLLIGQSRAQRRRTFPVSLHGRFWALAQSAS